MGREGLDTAKWKEKNRNREHYICRVRCARCSQSQNRLIVVVIMIIHYYTVVRVAGYGGKRSLS